MPRFKSGTICLLISYSLPFVYKVTPELDVEPELLTNEETPKKESQPWLHSYDSHVKPHLDYPAEGLNILFARALQAFPDKPACWFMERMIPYREVFDMVQRFASFLQHNGLQKGDVVAISLPNCPQYLVAHAGTIIAGGVSSGLSPLLSTNEVTYQINDSGAKFFVTLDAVYERVLTKILGTLPKLECIITSNISEYMGLSRIKVVLGKALKKIPTGKVTPWPGKLVISFKEVITAPAAVSAVDINPLQDLALLYYTGGTTGHPKGVELTHRNITANLVQVQNWSESEFGKDVFLTAFPFFHLAGMMMCNFALFDANPQVLIPNPRDTDHLIKAWIKQCPNIIANVPSLYHMIMNNPLSRTMPSEVLDAVRFYISGAAPFPAEIIRQFETKMHAENKVLEVYGMTETSPLLTSNPFKGHKKIGTVGLPFQDTIIRILDLETQRPAELGKPGEILCKGPQVTRGYRHQPEETAHAIDKDGWLHTGDVGVMDEDGFITIVDRVKDMLIVSGFKVFSVHVEDLLMKHPAIELVAIIGIKDSARPGSEIVKAVIKLKTGFTPTPEVQADIKKYAEEHLSKYENPKMWEFRDDIPLTAIGKVSKLALRIATTPQ